MLHQTVPPAAVMAFERGDLVSARSFAQQQLADAQRSPQLCHLMGLIECRLGKFGEGVEWLRQAVEMDGADPLSDRARAGPDRYRASGRGAPRRNG